MLVAGNGCIDNLLSVLFAQSDGVMTELGGVNGHAGTPVGGYPPSSAPQSTPTGSLPPTPHHPGAPHNNAHRPVDLSQAQRDSSQPQPTPIPYPLHDPTQRATLLDTGEYPMPLSGPSSCTGS